MLEAFLTILSEMLKIFLLLLLGYGINRFHIISREAEGVLSRFVTLLFLPSLMLYTNMMECRLDSLMVYGRWALWGLLFYGSSLLVSYPLARWFGGESVYHQGVYRYALTFPNSGSVGTPLILALFGTAGLFQYNLFALSGMFLTYSWGVANLQPSHGKTSLRTNLKKCINATFVAVVLGMILGLLDANLWMPDVVVGTVHSLSQCYVPVSLLLAGFSIADYPFTEMIGDLKLYLFSLYRLLIVPGVFLLVLYLCKAPLMLAIMTALCFAGPSGMNVVVYPAAYQEDCRIGAGMVLVSNLASLLTIPMIYALTLRIF